MSLVEIIETLPKCTWHELWLIRDCCEALAPNRPPDVAPITLEEERRMYQRRLREMLRRVKMRKRGPA